MIPSQYGKLVQDDNPGSENQLFVIGETHPRPLRGLAGPISEEQQLAIHKIYQLLIQEQDIDILPVGGRNPKKDLAAVQKARTHQDVAHIDLGEMTDKELLLVLVSRAQQLSIYRICESLIQQQDIRLLLVEGGDFSEDLSNAVQEARNHPDAARIDLSRITDDELLSILIGGPSYFQDIPVVTANRLLLLRYPGLAIRSVDNAGLRDIQDSLYEEIFAVVKNKSYDGRRYVAARDYAWFFVRLRSIEFLKNSYTAMQQESQGKAILIVGEEHSKDLRRWRDLPIHYSLEEKYQDREFEQRFGITPDHLVMNLEGDFLKHRRTYIRPKGTA
ncbi:hypothetical protein JW930_05465 [Candidatus Woesearchaeota archaeon]|nr:hypothetical protein [Candidatus Woesearchaeota archaeon]